MLNSLSLSQVLWWFIVIVMTSSLVVDVLIFVLNHFKDSIMVQENLVYMLSYCLLSL